MRKIKIRIPAYITPRTAWRRLIHAEAVKACAANGNRYATTDRLAIDVVLYLDDRQLESHDIDNRLKDIMDALQGRTGGPKAKRPLKPIIPNDNQIYRISAEKKKPPKQSRGLGHLTISKHNSK